MHVHVHMYISVTWGYSSCSVVAKCKLSIIRYTCLYMCTTTTCTMYKHNTQLVSLGQDLHEVHVAENYCVALHYLSWVTKLLQGTHTHTYTHTQHQHASVTLSCLHCATISLERHTNMLLAYIIHNMSIIHVHVCTRQLLSNFATLRMLHSSFVCNNQAAFNTYWHSTLQVFLSHQQPHIYWTRECP